MGTQTCSYLMHGSDVRYRIRGNCSEGCPEGVQHGFRGQKVKAPLGTKRAPKDWHMGRACPTPSCALQIHSVPFKSRWPLDGEEFRWYCCSSCGETEGLIHTKFCEG